MVNMGSVRSKILKTSASSSSSVRKSQSRRNTKKQQISKVSGSILKFLTPGTSNPLLKKDTVRQQRRSLQGSSLSVKEEKISNPIKKRKLENLKKEVILVEDDDTSAIRTSTIRLLKTETNVLPKSNFRYGLVRVPTTTTTNMDQIYEIRSGFYLGRSVPSSRKRQCDNANNKNTSVDLGIGSSNDGVSRHQLKILKLSSTPGNGITIQHCVRAPNPVGIIRGNATGNSAEKIKKRQYNYLNLGMTTRLHVGDIVAFDVYRKAAVHVFKLVCIPIEEKARQERSAGKGTTQDKSLKQAKKKKEEKNKIKRETNNVLSKTYPRETFAKESPQSCKTQKKSMKVKKEEDETEMIETERVSSNLKSEDSFTQESHHSFKTQEKIIEVKKEENIDATLFDENPNLPTRTAEIGDRFQSEFEVIDMFGRSKLGWYFCTVIGIAPNPNVPGSFLVDVEFDERSFSYELEWPCKGMEKIRMDTTQPKKKGLKNIFQNWISEESGKIAYTVPSTVKIGDLVDCYHQNGRSQQRWHRGRIAKVECLGNGKVCHVAYEHGKYECKVPVQQGNFRLVSSGSDSPNWLLGLRVHDVGRRRKGKILRFESKEGSTGATFLICYDDGSRDIRGYNEVVEMAFVPVHTKAVDAGNVKLWPSKKAAIKKEKVTTVIQTCSLDEGGINPKPVKIEGDVKSRKTTRKRKLTSALLTSSKKKIPPLTNEKIAKVTEDECSSEASITSHVTEDDEGAHPRSKQPRISALELHPSLGNSLARALNSAEPQNGASILVEMASVYSTIPNTSLANNIFDIIANGPKSEGQSFMDPNRSELSFQYATLISRRFHTGNNQNEALNTMLCRPWEDWDFCLSLPACVNPHGAKSGTRRIFHSLQRAACAVEYLTELLETDVSASCSTSGRSSCGDRNNSSIRTLFQSRPSNSIFLCPGGIRQALKQSTKYAIQCWMQLDTFLRHTNHNSELDQYCAMEAMRCLSTMGRLVSLISIVYARHENVQLNHTSLLLIIQDVILGEITKMNAGRSKELKMSFLLSLDVEMVSELQIGLGKIMGLSKEFPAID